MQSVKKLTALNAVTANSTSNLMWIGDFEKVVLRFSRDVNDSGGTSTFTVMAGIGQLPSDSPTMVPYSMLISNATNTNAQTLARVASVAIANSTTNVLVGMTKELMPTHIQIAVVETTDGTHSADIFGYSD